jgi:hypothetical protein
VDELGDQTCEAGLGWVDWVDWVDWAVR